MNELFKVILSLSISGSLAAVILLLLKPFYKNRLRKSWQYYIWFVILFRMLLPLTPETNFIGLFSANEENMIASDATEAEMNAPVNLVITNNLDINNTSNITQTPDEINNLVENNNPVISDKLTTKETSINLSGVLPYLLYIFPLTTLVLLIYKIVQYRRYTRFILTSRKDIDDISISEIYKEICLELKTKKNIPLYVNPNVNTPMLVGVLKPYIILPETGNNSEEQTNFTKKEYGMVLRHELTHYKRRDIWYKWFIQVVTCLHWFNPLMYLIRREIYKNCELACDEAVLSMLDTKEKRDYGDALMASIRKNVNYKNNMISIAMSEDGKNLKERLESIMSFSKKSILTRIFSCALALILISGAFFLGSYTLGKVSEVAMIDYMQSNQGGSELKNPIMETDIGYYFNNTKDDKLSLQYYDKNTGKTVFLCSKPECSHDGSSYCVATDNNIEIICIALYDNFIYICGLENNETVNLYRVSLDGAEFTTLTELMKVPKGFSISWPRYKFVGNGGLVIHQGKAFFTYVLYNLNDDEDGLTGIIMIDLSSMKHEIIEEGKRIHELDQGITRVKAADGYLYYIFNNTFIHTREKPSIKRYSIKDKTTEEIVVLDYAVITDFVIINNELWYSYQNLGAKSDSPLSYIMIYDTLSGETEEFKGELFNTVTKELKDAFGESYSYVRNDYFGYCYTIYDGTYLFVSNNCNLGIPYYYGAEPLELYIYSLDGTRLAQFSHEKAGDLYNISVLNGKVYFQSEELIDTCSVQDILDGNVIWKTEVLIENLTTPIA